MSINITINGKAITVAAGTTLLKAAETVGISIPALCHLENTEHFTSCMLCLVKDTTTGQLLPACSCYAQTGMEIETESEEVREARKDTLEMLLSEHVGDCEAPCQRGCPAHMDIPLMIRQIREGNVSDAIRTIKREIALPAVLGRICPAPCENACRRRQVDMPVRICLLKRFAADKDLETETPFREQRAKASGKRVAVVGAGPAGLSAAYYLSLKGHDCVLFESRPEPGGMLRYGVDDTLLDKTVLDAEIRTIAGEGIKFKFSKTLGTDITLKELNKDFDAVILAMGSIDSAEEVLPGIECSDKGVGVNRATFETSLPGVFAGGGMISKGKMAIRSAAHGKTMAESADAHLRGESAEKSKRFNSSFGKLRPEEMKEYMKEAGDTPPVSPGEDGSGYTEKEAESESKRCMHCDCLKADNCELRNLSTLYGASQSRYKLGVRRRIIRITDHEDLIFEPGKCIKCSKCVRITAKSDDGLGLSFSGRGFETLLEVPFGEPMSRGLKEAAAECVRNCPTAALAWRDSKTENKH